MTDDQASSLIRRVAGLVDAAWELVKDAEAEAGSAFSIPDHVVNGT